MVGFSNLPINYIKNKIILLTIILTLSYAVSYLGGECIIVGGGVPGPACNRLCLC